MKEATALALYRAAKRLGYTDRERDNPVRLHKEYSGRGMYGKTTFALVIPGAGTLAALAAATHVKRADRPALAEELRRLSHDSMGRDSIVVY